MKYSDHIHNETELRFKKKLERVKNLGKDAPRIPRSLLNEQIKSYLAEGGKITKLKTPEFEINSNPYNTQSSAIMADMNLMGEL